MVTILSISPHYNTGTKNTRTITAYTVNFSYQKKIAIQEITIGLDGSLTFACEDPVINLNEITNKIINYLQVTPND